ncbi:MAG TPA: sugar ABC transporter permease [Bacilli bacterium]|nr:sugar ABC transporter permease [Bacilli bacterium]
MEKQNSNPPKKVTEENNQTLFSNSGTGHYAHRLSSFTNVMIGIFSALGLVTFFIFRLIRLIEGFALAEGAFKNNFILFALSTLLLALLLVAGAVYASVNAKKLFDLAHDENSSTLLISTRANKQNLIGAINLGLTALLVVLEILMLIILQTNGVTPIAVPSVLWLILLFVVLFANFGYFVIARANTKAAKLGRDYYLTRPVEPVGLFESVFISLGNAAKGVVLFLFNFVMIFVKAFVNIFLGVYRLFVKGGLAIWKFLKTYHETFWSGSFRTKISYVFMGSGHSFMQRSYKTVIYLLLQIGYFVYMLIPGGGLYWLSKFENLGDTPFRIVEECGIPGVPLGACAIDDVVERTVFMDNSMLITLYSVATILLTITFFTLYWISIKGVAKADKQFTKAKADYKTELLELSENPDVELPKFKNPLPTLKNELHELLNSRFHLSTLSIPAMTITVFTVLPLIFMILLAFTNYNQTNGPPNTLFTWVGFKTFSQLFTSVGGSSFSKAFADILQWTFIWAFFATFTNYIFGLLLAMMINRKGIKLKKLWRTVFVITIAVPQFVTLLIMNQLLYKYGPINETLLQLGWIDTYIDFLTNPLNAKISVILVNVWVGVPYTMLITSGILMNIPSDLYESARIDGAGPIAQFTKITLPYMLFVTGPYLITQFIGNINNFNVIFFLTGGDPSAQLPGVQYGKTDILVTWLYDLTVGGAQQEYAIGSALGIFIFLISAFITLALYSKTSAATQEGDFA